MTQIQACGVCGGSHGDIREAEVIITNDALVRILAEKLMLTYAKGIPHWIGFHYSCCEAYEGRGITIVLASWRDPQGYRLKRWGY